MRADSGSVEVNGPCAYIHQELSLFPHLSVAENIMIGREPAQFGFIDRDELMRRSRELLKEFGREEIDLKTLVGRLSPAGRQVVEICRALAADARLILMDEPTSSLQRGDVDRLFGAIRRLCARGISVLYVSHFLEEVREIAERSIVLRDGKVVWAGAPAEISDEELIDKMRPLPLAEHGGGARGAGSRPGVALRGLSGGERLPLDLHAGEIFGIAGLVGSGRTEFLRTLMRADRGYLSEDRAGEGIFPYLSVRDNVMLARPIARFGWIDSKAETQRCGELMSRFNIRAANPGVSIRSLSGGNQQKVLLARLLQQDSNVLLLDEPTRGIDIAAKAEIYSHIKELAAGGKAIVMVSSYLPELFAVCDRLAVMTRGRLSEARPIAEWTPERVLDLAIGSGTPS
jgi:ribose transport system ATP-binding protein